MLQAWYQKTAQALVNSSEPHVPRTEFFKTLSKVASHPAYQYAVFEIYALKAEIKGVFSRSYHCYDYLLCHENNTNVFTSDWAFF